MTKGNESNKGNKGNITYDNWQLDAIIPAKALFYFEEAFAELANALLYAEIDKHTLKLSLIFQERPAMQEVNELWAKAAAAADVEEPDFMIGSLPHKNWLKENLLSFPPIDAGKFYIYGSHITKPKVPKDSIALRINASTAFGSGEHQTTKGCLLALSDLDIPLHNILDMGCGSGILGIAAAKLHQAKITSIDIDPEAARVTEESAADNEVAEFITARAGNGYMTKGVRANALYDLIFSNILARPLIKMSRSLSNNLKPAGYAIISGFLDKDADWVISHHEKKGLHLIRKYEIDSWITAVLQKE